MKALRILIPLALLALVWQVADGRQALARLAAADPLWLAAAFAALHAQTVLSALRWRLASGALGLPIPAGRAVREYYVAQIVNQTLPGGVTGDAARAVRTAAPGSLGPSVAAVMLDRAAGQAALFAVLLPGMAASLAFGRLDWPAPTLPVLAGAVALLVGAGTLMTLPRLGPARRAARAALAAPGLWPRQLALSTAIVALNLAAFAVAARATGTPVSLEATLTLVPLILTAMLVPLSIGGWGWREGAAAALFPLCGATPDAGLAASAAFGALILAAALPGALWLARPALRPPA